MKKILCAVAVLSLVCLGGTAFAQAQNPMLKAGTQELGLSGNFDFDDPGGDVSLDTFGSYGYFIQDYVELGGRVGYQREGGGDVEGLNLGVFGEYNFPASAIGVPFVGLALDYAYSDILGEDQDAFVLTPAVGVKWFIREYFAIDTRLFFNWATEDLYMNDGKLEDTNWGLTLGLRTYF